MIRDAGYFVGLTLIAFFVMFGIPALLWIVVVSAQ